MAIIVINLYSNPVDTFSFLMYHKSIKFTEENVLKKIIDKLKETRNLEDGEFLELLTAPPDEYLTKSADEVRRSVYKNHVYIRGLIEISNYCKNNCYYCGIRRDNKCVARYRLTKADILACCEEGYKLGFRTFVMQGGEDSHFSDDEMCSIISEIKALYPDCAVTLSLGERSFESYKALYDAGADRYLLRHEAASPELYKKLHPENMSLENRKECLFNLKKIGFQTGSGFMVGAPFQTSEDILADLRFLQELEPQMIGIGPFITHKDTPFANQKSGTLELTLKLISILRLMFPNVLLPATTALGTIAEGGRELGILAGANVVMPNLSPSDTRALYSLYDNKLHSGSESAQALEELKSRFAKIGFEIPTTRGDFIKP